MEILIGLVVIAVLGFFLWPKTKAESESITVVDLPAPTVTQVAAAAPEVVVETVAEPVKAPAKAAKAPAKKRTFVKREEGGTAKVAKVKAPAAKTAKAKTAKPKKA